MSESVSDNSAPASDPEETVLWTDGPTDHGHPPRWLATAMVALVLGLIAANNIGRSLLASSAVAGDDASGDLLEHPVRILALNSTNMHLLATGFQVDWGWFLTVPLLRLLAPDPLFYALGYLYRHEARGFVGSLFPGTDKFFDLMDADHEHRSTSRIVLEVMVFLAPNNPVCAIAGIMAMPIKRFIVLNLAGTVGRLVLFKLISTQFQDQVGDLINWVAKYQTYLMYAALALMVVNLAVAGRRITRATQVL